MREELIHIKNVSGPSPLRILLAGESFCDGSYYIERDGFSQAVLEYVISGRGSLTVNGETFYPQAGDVYLVPPMTHHRYASDALHPWHKLWLNIDGPFIPQLLAAYGLQGVLLVRQYPGGKLFQEALEKLRAQPEVSAARALETAGGLIADIGTYYTRHTSRGNELTPETVHLSEQDSFSLKELCRDSGISCVQMIRNFRKKYGKSPYAFWLENKLELSKTLLTNTGFPVKTVALECGFKDAAYFSRLFRRKLGISPAEYRRTNQKIRCGKRAGYRKPSESETILNPMP